MSNSGAVALNSPADVTMIATAKNFVCEIRDQLSRIESRMTALKYRLLGEQDDAEVATDNPEPVRSDTDELSHQLDGLRMQINRMESHLASLERL
jgi:uncharacterized coiled-coil protein SlyX